jgi:tetratricopeptide (TPR) repeat protein
VSSRDQAQDDDGFGEASRYTAHLDRGWSLLDRGDFQHARTSAQQALELRPDVPDAAMLLAAISLAESDPEASLEWYERAIETDAEYVDAQLAAAQVLLYDLEQPERALARAGQARDLEEATPADLLDFGLMEAEALVSLGDPQAAAQRLDQLTELWVIEDLLDAETGREQLSELLRQFAGLVAGLGEEWFSRPLESDVGSERDRPAEFEPEELELLMGRVVSLAVRVARLHMELGSPESALPWLDGLLRRFGDDPDIWYLTNEAAYLAGYPVRAAHAALQVLQLDARASASESPPPPDQIHAKVVELLLGCADPALRTLAREASFVVVVNDAPPFELVLEGVDPRARVLALAARTGRDEEAAPTLTGLAIYRRNLPRMDGPRIDGPRVDGPPAEGPHVEEPHVEGPHAEEPRAEDDERTIGAVFERELALAVFDELSVFFGFDAARRERLGLPSSDWRPAPRATELTVADPAPRETPRESKGNTTKPSAKPKSKPKRKSKPSETTKSKPAKVKVEKSAKPEAKPRATPRKPSDEAED